jgi:hypothetical protein
MLDELNAAIGAYEIKWHALVSERKEVTKAFFGALKPTAVAWKCQEPGDFDKRFASLRAFSDQVHLGWVNKRWLATFHLRDQKLAWGIEVIKLMQTRPGSPDRAGLDHLDFLTHDAEGLTQLKAHESVLKITEEQNGEHCRWTSIWFEGTEAKIRTDTVLDTCAAELLETNEHMLAGTTATHVAEKEAGKRPQLPPAQAQVAAAAAQAQAAQAQAQAQPAVPFQFDPDDPLPLPLDQPPTTQAH